MTDPTPPRIPRLQQLIEKSAQPDAILSDDDALLDMRAGMFLQLTDVHTPAAIREVLTEFLDLCREQGAAAERHARPRRDGRQPCDVGKADGQ